MGKKELRTKLKNLRGKIIAGDAPEKIRDSFLKKVQPNEGARIATYIPYGSELSVDKLNRALGYAGYKLSLPTITDENGLLFREWDIHTRMVKNRFGILEPHSDSLISEPEIVIIPLLGFNAWRFRLGYGGGYYDRTLENSKALKVGIAYAGQEVEENFQEDHDVQMDMVITEKKIFS